MEAIRLERTIEKTGELHLTDISVVEGQQVELLLLFPTADKASRKKPLTARQLLKSQIVGMWKNRTDIGDSVEYARQLRETAQKRRR